MGKLADLYDRMTVTARSPDRSVTLHLTGRGDITVELAAGVIHTHTEATLERQLDATVRVVIAAYQKASHQAYLAAVGESSVNGPEGRA
jgi:hypothetical protein